MLCYVMFLAMFLFLNIGNYEFRNKVSVSMLCYLSFGGYVCGDGFICKYVLMYVCVYGCYVTCLSLCLSPKMKSGRRASMLGSITTPLEALATLFTYVMFIYTYMVVLYLFYVYIYIWLLYIYYMFIYMWLFYLVCLVYNNCIVS